LAPAAISNQQITPILIQQLASPSVISQQLAPIAKQSVDSEKSQQLGDLR